MSDNIKIIKEGTLDRIFAGECAKCGCKIEAAARLVNPTSEVICPTDGCCQRIQLAAMAATSPVHEDVELSPAGASLWAESEKPGSTLAHPLRHVRRRLDIESEVLLELASDYHEAFTRLRQRADADQNHEVTDWIRASMDQLRGIAATFDRELRRFVEARIAEYLRR